MESPSPMQPPSPGDETPIGGGEETPSGAESSQEPAAGEMALSRQANRRARIAAESAGAASPFGEQALQIDHAAGGMMEASNLEPIAETTLEEARYAVSRSTSASVTD